MAEFITELITCDVCDDLCKLYSPLIYRSDILGDVIEVPQGFVTDFASVPRVPLAYMAYGNRAHRESVIHDYLYQTGCVTRLTADRIFLEAMKVRGKPLWVRWGMYMGVRLGGWVAWNKYRKSDTKK